MKSVRKLAALSIGYSLAVFAAHYILPSGSLYIISAVAAMLAASGLLFRGNKRRLVILVAIAMSLGFAGYRYHYDNTVALCEELAGKTMLVEAKVLDYPDKLQFGNRVYVRLCDDKVPNVRAMLFDYDNALPDIRPGDMLKAEIKFRSAIERYGEASDGNISDGVYIVGNLGDYFEHTGSGNSVRFCLQELGKLLRDEIRSVFPKDSSPFMLALLTGDKSEYYGDDSLYTSMSISGLSHIVAVSGMHVSFLVAFLQLVMGKNRRSSIACLVLIWSFGIMSGSSPSAVRAGLMLSICLMAPIFNRENDRITTLSFALALILASNPFAAGSVSLQLSFAAMTGIYLFASPIFDYVSEHTPRFGKLPRLKVYLVGTLSSSLAVTVFSVPLIAAHFGYISLLAPIANILCLWAVSILFVGGYAVCLLGFAMKYAAVFLAEILSYLVRYIVFVVKYTARIPFAAIYTENFYAVMWIVFVYLAFFISRFGRDKTQKLNPLVPTIISIVALISVFAWTKAAMLSDSGTIGIMDVGSGQCIALTEAEHTVVIDCGSKGTNVNAGSEVSSYLHSRGRTKIDCLLLTHLHTDHADGAVRLMSMMKVDKLILPQNADENADDGILTDILSAAEANGVEVVYIDRDTYLEAGDILLNIYAAFDEGDRNERGVMLTANVGDKSILVTGDVSQSTERKLVDEKNLSGTDILMVGHHGSKYSTSEELLMEAKPELAVISVGYNSYGHPTPEVLEKLEYYGVTTYRTDLSGRILISTGD